MKKEMKNHRNGFFKEKPSLLLNQYTKKPWNYHWEETNIISRGLVELSRWRKKLEWRERKRKQLLLQDITTAEDSFYRWFLMLWKLCIHTCRTYLRRAVPMEETDNYRETLGVALICYFFKSTVKSQPRAPWTYYVTLQTYNSKKPSW
jgi:hypothetical protein